MCSSFNTIGLIGRSQQGGISDVLQELMPLLQGRGLQLLLEDRLDEIAPGHDC